MKTISFRLATVALLLPLFACGTQSNKVVMTETPAVQPAETSQPVSTPKTVDKQDLAKLDGEWIIESVGKTQINREENYPYINFVNSDNSFYASNGCNTLNGAFTIEKSHKIVFHNVLSTMRLCPDAPFEAEINAVIADEKPAGLKFEQRDGHQYLYLLDNSGNKLMTLRKPGFAFLNGNWQVTAIGAEKFENSEMKIFFDVAERKVHGNTGCNSFNGEIFVDPQNASAFSLSNMAVTMRMCPNIDQQSKFLVALEQTTGAKRGSNGVVYLTDHDGKNVVTLRPLPVEK